MTTTVEPTRVAMPPAARCPRCGEAMATFERSGVLVDQCGRCRGVFLDRGELEQIVASEAWARPSADPQRPWRAPDRPYPARTPDHGYTSEWHPDDDSRRWDERCDRSAPGPGRPARRGRGLLGELLEGFGD